MPGHVYKRGSVYWIKFYAHGKQYRKSSKSERKRDAEHLLSKYMGEIAAGTFHGFKEDTPSIGMRELLDDFITDCNDRKLRDMNKIISHLRPVREYFDGLAIGDVTVRRIDLYKKQRLTMQRSGVTINRELQLLGQALRLAHKRELIVRVPPIQKYREDNVRQGFFEHEEFLGVLNYLPDDLKDYVAFGYYSGWRKGEITALEWRDIDGDMIRLRPEVAKNKTGRMLAVEGEVADIIKRRMEARLDLIPLVFHRDGEPVLRFDKAWRTACKKAGVSGKLFHDLRRTTARNLSRAGVPDRIAMSIMGHKTRSMYDRYNIVSEEDIRESARKVQEHIRSHKIVTFTKKG